MLLQQACRDGDLGEVTRLVEEERVDPRSCRDGKSGTTPLHRAARQGHLDIVRYLVEEKACDVMCRDKNGDTPLNAAALGGKLDTVQYLISERGCDPMVRGQYGRTPLHSACQNGHLDVVRYLIDDQGVDPSCRDDNDFTPLHMACETGQLSVVRYLVEERECDVMCRNKKANTPLHVAALGGKLDTVQYLISERGCDPMVRGQYGRTPLHSACQNGHLDVVRYLIDDKGVDPSCRDDNDATPLHMACGTGQLSVVRLLVEDCVCDTSVKNKFGKSPLDYARQFNKLQVIAYLYFRMEEIPPSEKLLLACQIGNLTKLKCIVDEYHVDPASCRDSQSGNSPLHLASYRGHLAMVRYLIEEKACDVMCRDKNGNTPLNVAALGGKLDTMQYLISERGCDPMLRGFAGRTLLHSACGDGHLDVVRYLIEDQGVDPSYKNDHDATPLHIAASFGTLEVVRYLIEEKACDVMCRDKNGHTPLNVAALGDKLDTVQYLISERGCDPMVKGQYGGTPLHYACQNGHLDVVRYLIDDQGVDPSCRDDDDTTPLHIACEYRQLTLVRLLVNDYQCDIGVQNKLGVQPFSYAHQFGTPHGIASCLLSRMEQISLLQQACSYGNLAKVKQLVEEKHIDPRLCTGVKSGNTPLHCAAHQGHLDIVRYLVEEKACDVMCRSKNGNTPLNVAAWGGKLDTVQYLISEGGCDPMVRGKHGKTPLHRACSSGHIDVVMYLTENPANDPSCRDENDCTPLHEACRAGHLSITKLLVEECLCDPGVTDKQKRTPLDYACKYTRTEIISYLVSVQQVVSTDLRRALLARLKSYTRKAKPTEVELGSGTYGSVIEVESYGEMLAGKKFRTLSTVNMQAMMDKICGEMILMMQIRHANIVESKGVCFLVNHPLPVLLMERMMSSLHAYLLDPANIAMQLSCKLSILCDVARGLDYLHHQVPAIIHRDLTATNVLIDSKLNAKIGDFGNSRLLDLDPEATPETFTSLPGTPEYMPPETQGKHTKYESSLDVFSFGHLALFTVTQSRINLLPPSYTETEFGETKLHARSEVSRRTDSIDKLKRELGAENKLVALIKQCLHNIPAQRPRTGMLLKNLQSMSPPKEDQQDKSIPDREHGRRKREHEGDNAQAETLSVGSERALQAESSCSVQDILSTVPTLYQLRSMRTPDGNKVEVIKSVAPKWKDICIQMDFDPTGDTMDLIASTERDPESCSRSMFQKWLKRSEVQPATWGTLIQILEECKCNNLVGKVKGALKISTDDTASGKL